MLILKTNVFHGPNRWSASPVLEAHVQFDPLGDQTATSLSRLTHDLHKLTGVTLVAFPPVATTSPSIFVLPFEFEELGLLRECLDIAIRLIQSNPNSVAKDQDNQSFEIDFSAERKHLLDLADQIRLGPSSRSIINAAALRGIPFRRLNQGSLVQLGEGVFQRRIWTAETDATSAIAESIASDKQLTRSMLEAVGVNVPRGRAILDREDAWKAALEIGLPVAVKPRSGNHACGVSLDLTDREAVLSAYDWACDAGKTTDILIEQFIVGDHHRLLVVGDRMVAAARGQREYVIGDGRRTVTELVHEFNSDPRRGENYSDQLDIVNLNESAAIALGKQGLQFDSVPALDQQVLIRYVGDLIEDCTDRVHPSTRQAAVLAAKVIGLDIAGMDLVVQDISRPLSEQRGSIIEVNAGPSLSPHVAPLIGSPQPVGEAIVDLLFPKESLAKVPIVLIVADSVSDRQSLIASVAVELGKNGLHVGMASERLASSKEGMQWPLQRPVSEFSSLLIHPFLDAIVLELTPLAIMQSGLPCGHVDIAVIPDWFFETSSPAVTSPTADPVAIDSVLQTLHHLMLDNGQMLVRSERKMDRSQISHRIQLPEDRINYVANDHQTIKHIVDRLPQSMQTIPLTRIDKLLLR